MTVLKSNIRSKAARILIRSQEHMLEVAPKITLVKCKVSKISQIEIREERNWMKKNLDILIH